MRIPKQKPRVEVVDELEFTVPGVPPSVNHYKIQKVGNGFDRRGRPIRWTFVTKEALKFKSDVALCAGKKGVRHRWLNVQVQIVLGAKMRGDLDNFPKCLLDGLVEAGAIETDSSITGLFLTKRRDVTNPHTRIRIWKGESV